MIGRKLKLLLWKGYRLRRNKWKGSLAIIIIPILLTFLVAKFGGNSVKRVGNQRPAYRYPPNDRESLLKDVYINTLLYAPSNEFTDKLMNNVAEKIGIKKEQLRPFSNEYEVEVYLSKNEWNSDEAVIFNNLPSDGIPNKLDYAIRKFGFWYTRKLYYFALVPGPYPFDRYKEANFAVLQLMIDDQFIRLKTSKTDWPTKQIFYQPAPYPEYIQEDNLDGQLNRKIFLHIIAGVLMTTFLILTIPVVTEIITEKEGGLKELMKLASVDEWAIWLSWFLNVLILSVVTITVSVKVLQTPFNGEGTNVIQYIPFIILWTVLVIYSIANVTFCFLFAAIFHKASVATSVCMIIFCLAVFGGMNIVDKVPTSVIQLSFIVPFFAFMKVFGGIRDHELQATKFTWSSFMETENSTGEMPPLFALLMLIFDSFFYIFLSYYISSINPGPFGVPKSPFFIFKCLFPRTKKDHHEQLLKNSNEQKSEFIEKPPATLDVTLQIRELYKIFGSTVAVNGINLDICKGEIFALLGHNGAGKTTTLAILTGLTPPSNGSISFKNMDVFGNMVKFREYLGMCPQEDRLFSYLTVFEHLIFFGMLKGATAKEAEEEAEDYLSMMELEPKKHSLPNQLSGGMKRKLCLAIALMGKSQILILDEPTSGMDVQTRRNIWDLLLELRSNRTIILTTHFMEEADALGDRIAIMQAGNIVCYGTPIFLKKAYGTGYRLTITKASQNSIELTEVITNIIPGSELEEESQNEVNYKLPFTESAKFPELFRSLESDAPNLGIQNIGISCTTMEHVFLKAGGASTYNFKRSTMATSDTHDTQYLRRKKGLSLFGQQLTTLFMKKMLSTVRNIYDLYSKFVMSTLILLVILRIFKVVNESARDPALPLSLKLYQDSKVLLQVDTNANEKLAKAFTNEVINQGSKTMKSDSSDIIEGLLDYGRKNLKEYKRDFVVAAQFNTTHDLIVYNLWAIHSFPIAINMYSNAIIHSFMGNDEVSIRTTNYPAYRNEEYENFRRGIDILLCIGWFLALAHYTNDALFKFIEFANKERLNGFKHIQMMSNVSPLVYWLSSFLFDYFMLFVIITIRIFLFKIFDEFGFLAFDKPLAMLVLLLAVGGMSILVFIYVLSHVLDSSGSLLTVANISISIIVGIFFIAGFDTYRGVNLTFILFVVTKYVILFVPPMNFALIFMKYLQIWSHNSQCMFYPSEIKAKCEESLQRYNYLVYSSGENPAGILQEFLFLVGDIVLYSVILVLIDYGIVGHGFNALKNSIFGTEKTVFDRGDDDVKREYNKIRNIKTDPIRRRQISLLVDGLRKNYINWCHSFTAVADVSFIVEPGECFGLLGVNGAGKTTTFKILTSEIWPTLGDAAIEGFKLSANKKQYLSMAGYCAQTNCFLEELTGREMLTMIAKLRGVAGNDIQKMVDKWISIVGLTEFQNRPCGQYSGGNKRKTCTAMALIGDPRVVFLDEPTSGVDPVSRRKLYDVMEQSRALGQSVILTSHSMEECETLCDRITIMAKGVMKCLGTVQHLKKRYAQGFSLMIKLRSDSVTEENVNNLKTDMERLFRAGDIVLKDEHKGLLYYQLKDTNLLWSTLFERMENMKHLHNLITDDYVLTDTTLEEIFISFSNP